MTFGFQIQNSSGDVVIDADYQNHTVAETGSFTAASPGNVANTITFANSYAPGRQPMLFARCTGDFVGFYAWVFTGSNVTGATVYTRAGGSTVDWKLLATPTGASSDTFGARIYDGSGNLVFDAGLNYLNLVDAVSFTASGPDQNVTHASATTPFYCISAGKIVAAAQTSGAPTSGFFIGGYKAINGTTVAQGVQIISEINGLTGFPLSPSSPTILVMDAAAPSVGSGYGVNIWNASGGAQLGISSKLTRFLYTTLANAGVSGSASVSGLDPTRCVGVGVSRGTFFRIPHAVTLSSGTVTWTAPASSSIDTDVLVIQYK